MDLKSAAFAFSILVSATAAIIADHRNQKLLSYFFRPFTIILMIGLLIETRPYSFYRNAMVAGLALCLLGELMMMLKKKRFLTGLAFFLGALAVFTVAFYSRVTREFLNWPVIPLALLAAVVLFLIWPGLKRERVPVLFYLLVLLTMTRVGLEQPHQLPGAGPWLAAAGSFLFLLSDSILAINRYRRPFRSAQIIILSTFYLALLLLTLSV
ncbi:MAG: lysoplasmalogenase [Candidatus Saccharicenans sp.]|uniref:lysoplasmalogenase n=1 Tax=Candidatus Saccharicenans sp. TaxID=2819258 RepID=UPI00404AB11E